MNMRLAILRNAFISVGALLGMLSFAAIPPNETAVTSVKLVPVIVTTSPPSVDPSLTL